jgi:hypothetical protein
MDSMEVVIRKARATRRSEPSNRMRQNFTRAHQSSTTIMQHFQMVEQADFTLGRQLDKRKQDL